MTRTLLQGGVDAAGRPLDVLVDAVSATIVAAGPALDAPTETETHDCSGMTLLPAPAEPHAHLDKALSMRVRNPTGDLEPARHRRSWPLLSMGGPLSHGSWYQGSRGSARRPAGRPAKGTPRSFH